MSYIYVNYLYLAHSEMYIETKYVHPCGTHTSFFQQNFFFCKKNFSCGYPVCRLGAHTLSHYTFFSRSDMVLYLCKISASYVKWKCKSRGVKLSPSFYMTFLGVSCAFWVHTHIFFISFLSSPYIKFFISKNSCAC